MSKLIQTKDKRFAWLEINLIDFKNNLDLIKKYAISKNTKIMAIVKADAYGHGAVKISQFATKHGVDAFGVAFTFEGIELRNAGILKPIYILREIPPQALKEAIEYDFVIPINSLESAVKISNLGFKFNKKIGSFIYIDTGMNRLGINFNKAYQDITKIVSLGNMDILGLATHFAAADKKDFEFTLIQWERLNKVIQGLREKNIIFKLQHCANSAAFFLNKEFHLDMVRPGLSIYGINPFEKNFISSCKNEEIIKALLKLRPILSFKARISFIKKVLKGESISYGCTYVAKRESIIGTIPVGYSDGYSRFLSNRQNVLVNGKFAPITGNITMDQLMIDLTDICKKSKIKVGDEVVLVGEQDKNKILAYDIAYSINSIPNEFLTCLSNRLPKIYIE